jgi:hypothetical protein
MREREGGGGQGRERRFAPPSSARLAARREDRSSDRNVSGRGGERAGDDDADGWLAPKPV